MSGNGKKYTYSLSSVTHLKKQKYTKVKPCNEVFTLYFSLAVILEAFMLASSLSMDAFVASFAYGSNKIKIPFLSNQIINIVSSSILGISLFAGAILRQYLVDWVTLLICFTLRDSIW